MSCEEYRLQIPEYLAGGLNASQAADFEAHLDRCEGLRRELEEMGVIWRGLELIPQEEPSAVLRAGFYRRLLEAERPGRSARVVSFGGWMAQPAFAWAAAVVLFAAGWSVGGWRNRPREAQQDVAQLRGEVQNLRQMMALSLLDGSSANARLEGVSWSQRVDGGDREVRAALLSTLNHDSNVNVRLSAVDALQKFAGDPAMRTALEDAIPVQDSPLVQIALIDALAQNRDQAASPALRRIVSGAEFNGAVRQRAQWAVQKLEAR